MGCSHSSPPVARVATITGEATTGPALERLTVVMTSRSLRLKLVERFETLETTQAMAGDAPRDAYQYATNVFLGRKIFNALSHTSLGKQKRDIVGTILDQKDVFFDSELRLEILLFYPYIFLLMLLNIWFLFHLNHSN